MVEVHVVQLLVCGRLLRHRMRKFSGWTRALAATLLVAVAFPAAAAHVEVQGGRSYMDNYGSDALFVEGVFAESRMGNSRFTWSPDVSLGWIDGRDLVHFNGARYGTKDSVTLISAGARFRYGDADAWYHSLFFSFQPALQTGRTIALSSSYEFVSSLGWQGRHLSFQLRHISDGGLHGPNRGETMALVGVGFDL